jgi:NAD(P)-dependent dehydrogenase (short-subunit alcohol dehydrogenase family)
VAEPMASAIKRMGTPEEAGNLIAFLLSDESAFISGACHGLDGAWNC